MQVTAQPITETDEILAVTLRAGHDLYCPCDRPYHACIRLPDVDDLITISRADYAVEVILDKFEADTRECERETTYQQATEDYADALEFVRDLASGDLDGVSLEDVRAAARAIDRYLPVDVA